MVEHHAVAGDDVGGNGAERDGEVVEVLYLRHRQGESAQDLRELLALHQSARQTELPAFDAQRELDQVVLVFELSPEVEIGARRPVAEGVLPVHRGHDPFDVARREPGGIQTTHHGAHAGAGDGVDGNVVLFQNLEHADVGGASRATAGEHQADARPALCARRRRASCADTVPPPPTAPGHGKQRCSFRALIGIVGVVRIDHNMRTPLSIFAGAVAAPPQPRTAAPRTPDLGAAGHRA